MNKVEFRMAKLTLVLFEFTYEVYGPMVADG